MARPASVAAPVPQPKPRLPAEAVGMYRDSERKWCVCKLGLIDDTVCEVKVIEKTIHRDLAQDAMRRAVLHIK